MKTQKRKKDQADWYNRPKSKRVTVDMARKMLDEIKERTKPQPIQLDGVFVSKHLGPYQVIGFGGPQGGIHRGVSIFSTQGKEITPFLGRHCRVTIEVVD